MRLAMLSWPGRPWGGLDGFSNAGGWDMFVINLDTSGVLQWTYQTGTSSNDEVGGLQIDAAGDIFIAGDTQGGFSGLTNAGLYIVLSHTFLGFSWDLCVDAKNILE